MARFRVNFLVIIVCVLVFGGCENPSGGGDHPYPPGTVEDIINLPTTAYVGKSALLTGKVIPENATAKTITWQIVDVGGTGAAIEDDTLTTTTAGTVRIEARIVDGKGAGNDFTKTFSVVVEALPEHGVRLRIDRSELTDGYLYLFTSTDPVTVTIENIGKKPTGGLTVTLSGNNSTSFQLNPASVSSIATDEEGAFTVAPQSNLSSGTHNATVSVTGSNDISATFDVSYTVTAKPAGEQAIHAYNGVTMNFRYVPLSPQPFAINEYENTASITRGYWVMETEVTQELWSKVFNEDPSFFNGDADDGDYDFSKATPAGETQNKRPVDSVNWYAAIAFCNKLSTLAGKTRVYESDDISDFNTNNFWQDLDFSDIPKYEDYDEDWDAITMNKTANGYRLPTEVEWLWAAIGATKGGADVYTKGCIKGYAGSAEGWDDDDYAIIENVEEYVWYGDNSGEVTHQVGKKTANELGLYDMSGNVQEWCFDWYEMNNWYEDLDPDYVQDTTAEDDPTRMTHGGSFLESYWISPSERYELPPCLGDPEDGYCAIVGFRIVCNE